MRHSLSIFIFLSVISQTVSVGQKPLVSADTVYIQTLIDSCKNLYENMDAPGAIAAGQNTLSLIETVLVNADTKTKKRLKMQKATLLRVIGNVYKDVLVDYPKTLDYYQQCLKTAREVDDKVNIGGALFNTGEVYRQLKEYEKALDFLSQSLKTFEEIGHDYGIAFANNSLGLVYESLKEYSPALNYYQKSLDIYNVIQDTVGAATQLNNMAVIYVSQKRFSEALTNYERSLKMYEAMGDSSNIAFPLAGIGNIYLDGKKNPKQAETYFIRTLAIARNFNLELEKNALEALKDLYHDEGRYKEAFEMYDQYILIKDSISSQQNAEEIRRRELVSDFDEKQAKLQAAKEKQETLAEEEHKRQELIIWSVAGGLLLVAVFSVFMFNRWRVTQKQKEIIEVQKTEVENQKHLVEVHQKEIIDSITYAKRLQEAILPPLDFVKKHLPDSFILYKPKDIVAGDFYWMYAVPLIPPKGGTTHASSPPSGGRGAVIFIAAADCTGHGVPGAMVSVVCCNALNRAVKEFGLRDTGKILDKVTELVLETFEKSGEDVKDGMDISLLAVQFPSPYERDGRVRLQWSGANNPLWYIQKGEVLEIKPDKQPIGKHDNRKPFTTHTISLQPNTTFYLFTDGYADQFGGPKGKKFKYKKLEEKLVACNNMPLTEQKDFLNKNFVEWKGDLEQVDDVCIIGIRI